MKISSKQRIVAFAVAMAIIVAISTLSYTWSLSYATLPSEPSNISTLVSVGTGEVIVSPDRAKIFAQITSQAETAKAAATQTAMKFEALLAALQDIGLTTKDLETTSYNISPVYEYPRDGKPILIGYSAVHGILVTVGAGDQAALGIKSGQVVDAIVSAGVDQIQYIQFTASDYIMKEASSKTLKLAVQEASSKAQLISEALGVRLIGVVKVSEVGVQPIPIQLTYLESRTQLIPGNITVKTSVEVIYQIASSLSSA